MSSSCVIYTLADPVTDEVRYVGKTVHTERRLRGHLNERGQTHKNRWITSLSKVGKTPRFEVLEEVPSESWQEAERFWVETLKFLGCRLTNGNGGGFGGHNPSTEARFKIGQANKRRIISKATRDKLSKSAKLRDKSPEFCAKLSKALKGRQITPGWRNKISVSNTGKTRDEETRKKLSDAAIKANTPEKRRRISLTLKGVKKSAAHREAIRLSWVSRRKKNFPPVVGIGNAAPE